MKKFLIFLFLLLFPLLSFADTQAGVLPEKVFTAKVTKILSEQYTNMPDGSTVKQQNLLLQGLDGDYKGKTIEYDGIGQPEMTQSNLSNNLYKVGDEVSVEANFDAQGNVSYSITDYVRVPALEWLTVIFIIASLIVGRWKGFRSLVALGLTFLIIMKYILPQIMDGSDPVIVTLIGSFFILLAIIYITEGLKINAHIAVASIFLSLIATVVLSWFFVDFAKLSGLSNEEASFLVGYGGQIVNFQGLLLAGIIIGALGVLDDVVIAQVAVVEQLKSASSGLTGVELFKKSFKVGISHISAMVNTLFLAYAGVSLPLLILFISGQSAFSSSTQALNNEALATEIVRTLTGSIGLILAVPISTVLAVWWYKRK